MEEVKYTYSVTPRKRIKSDSIVLKSIRVPKTVLLTKKEVYDAIKSGAIIYRRFDASTKVKVNLMNLERLHQAEYDSVKEQFITPINFDDEEKEVEVVEEKIEDPVIPVEENKKETPIVDIEETADDIAQEEEEVADVIEPTVEVYTPVEANTEPFTDVVEPVVEDYQEESRNTQNNNKKYNNTKKHH